MDYEWDEVKRRRNIAKHGIDFATIFQFEWDTAFTERDMRYDYGEERLQSFGFVGERLFVLVWTERQEGVCRIINLRKANSREIRRYERARREG